MMDSNKNKNFELRYEIFAPVCFFYALFYALCLYKNMSGITFPFFTAGTAGFLAYCSARCGITWKKRNYYTLTMMMALSVSTCMTAEPLVIAANWVLYVVLLIWLDTSLFLDTDGWTVHGAAGVFVKTLFGSIGKAFAVFSDHFDRNELDMEEQAMDPGKEPRKKNRLFQSMVGLMVSVPLIIVIVVLLMSADEVFRKDVEHMLGTFRMADIVCIVLLICAVYMLSYGMLSMLSSEQTDHAKEENEKHSPAAASAAVLIIAVIYVYFSWIQFSYLFMHGQKLPDGMSYASYARSGFFQLLAVCLINLVIVAVMMYLFKKNRLMQQLLIVISLCTIVMTCSSTMRMLMYIDMYAMTFLRLTVLWTLAGIAWVMAFLTVKLAADRFPAAKVILGGAAIWYLVFVFCRPGQFVARYDMNMGGDFADEDYLEQLSLDSVPEVITEQEAADYGKYSRELDSLHVRYDTDGFDDDIIDADPDYGKIGHEGEGNHEYAVRYRKLCAVRPVHYEYIKAMKEKLAKTDSTWRTWNFSRSRAAKLLDTD